MADISAHQVDLAQRLKVCVTLEDRVDPSEDSNMWDTNVPHLPTKTTDKEHMRQFPMSLHGCQG